ncbi:hypothetical protein BU17DRAFT_79610 [Hysterangium stoloniferum]|nr:hypothetical protein BU17DRAFT_79610 [Hysterangium stoloniferum]
MHDILVLSTVTNIGSVNARVSISDRVRPYARSGGSLAQAAAAILQTTSNIQPMSRSSVLGTDSIDGSAGVGKTSQQATQGTWTYQNKKKHVEYHHHSIEPPLSASRSSSFTDTDALITLTSPPHPYTSSFSPIPLTASYAGEPLCRTVILHSLLNQATCPRVVERSLVRKPSPQPRALRGLGLLNMGPVRVEELTTMSIMKGMAGEFPEMADVQLRA